MKARAAALEAPLSDEDAEALATLVNGGDMEGDVTEDKYDAMMAQISALEKPQLDQMVAMSKMMAGMMGGGLEGMAQQIGAAMGVTAGV